MALPNIPYAPNTSPQMVWLDQTFAAVAALGIVPCTAAGANAITLTLNANTPTISAYANYLQFAFVAVSNSSAGVTVQVGSLSALNLYLPGGTVQASAGDLTNGVLYIIAYQSTLNAGAGGFVIVSATDVSLSVPPNPIGNGADPAGSTESSVAIQTTETNLPSTIGSPANFTYVGQIVFPPGRYKNNIIQGAGSGAYILHKSPNSVWTGYGAELDFSTVTAGSAYGGIIVTALTNGTDGTLVNGAIRGLMLKGHFATTTGSTLPGSNVVSVTTSTNMLAGQAFIGTGIPAYATISSVDSAVQVTLSTTANSGGGAITVFAIPTQSTGIVLGWGSSTTSYSQFHALDGVTLYGFGNGVIQKNNGYGQGISNSLFDDCGIGISVPTSLNTNSAEQWDLVNTRITNCGTGIQFSGGSMDLNIVGGSLDYNDLALDIANGAAIATVNGTHIESNGFQTWVKNTARIGTTGAVNLNACHLTIQNSNAAGTMIDATALSRVIIRGGWLRYQTGTQGNLVTMGSGAGSLVIDSLELVPQGGSALITNLVNASSGTPTGATIQIRMAPGYGSLTNVIFCSGNTAPTCVVDLGNGISNITVDPVPGQIQHGTTYVAITDTSMSLPRASTVWPGWGFKAVAKGGPVKLIPTSQDSINVSGAGQTLVIPLNTSRTIVTDGSGTYYAY